MALPTDVDISSYDRFRATTIGRGFDIDGRYGYQCWDFGAMLWGLTGHYTYPYLSTGGTGYAYGCWTAARDLNAGTTFDLIYNIGDVKRGDMVIWDRGRYTGDVSGHNGFADEDYNGSGYIMVLGQNQENPSATVGHVATVDRMSINKFLGAFRYKAWGGGPGPGPGPGPTPTGKASKKKFPWFIYNQRRNLTH